MQIILQGGNDYGVIFALWQTGDADGAYASSSGEENGETPAVGSVVLQFEACRASERSVIPFMLEAEGVGAAVIARDSVALAANPIPIVWSGSGHRVRKQGKAVKLYVDNHGDLPFFGSGFEGGADSPCCCGIKMFELQDFFLQGNFFEVT